MVSVWADDDKSWDCDDTNCDNDENDEKAATKHPNWLQSQSEYERKKCRDEWREHYRNCCGHDDDDDKWVSILYLCV